MKYKIAIVSFVGGLIAGYLFGVWRGHAVAERDAAHIILKEHDICARRIEACELELRRILDERDTDESFNQKPDIFAESSVDVESCEEYEDIEIIEPDDVYAPLREDPYVINEEDFEQCEPYYDKISLVYYAEDAILADEDDSIITDTGTLISDSIYMSLETFYAKCPVIYVRNEKLSADFEIRRINGSYQELVLGE